MTASTRASQSAASPAAAGGSAWPARRACLLIFCVTLFAYFPAVQGGFIWDDAAHVTRQDLQSLRGLERIWFDVGGTQQYYPLLHTAFWIEHHLWGDWPAAYHLLNVLLQATAACLLGFVLRRVLDGAEVTHGGSAVGGAPPGLPKGEGSRSSVPAKLPAGVEWFAALLFALHPVCVESVAWISEQKNTLSAVFYLGSALTYLQFSRDRRRSRYWVALGLFGLALMTKTVTATLPAALLVVFWWQRGRVAWRRDVVPLLPWFAFAMVGGLFTAWVERYLIGAQGAEFALTLPERFLLAGRAIWFYLAKLAWPADLIFIYPRWTIEATAGALYLFPAAVLAWSVALWSLSRRGRGFVARAAAAALAGFLIFAGTLFPALGFFNVYPFIFSYVADHFQYLASVGILAPTAAGMALGSAFLQSRAGTIGRWSSRVAGGLLLLTLGTLTWRQCGIYRDPWTLFRETLARNPNCAMAHNGLGDLLARSPARRPEAIAQFREALRLNPRDALAHNNLGYALASEPARLTEAVAEYKAALEIFPEFSGAHNNLGVALERIPGRMPEAIAHLREAVQLDPDDADFRNNLGVALTKVPGRGAEAIMQFEAGVRLNPGSADLQNNLGVALADAPGRLAEAIAHFEAAARLHPRSAEIQGNLGAALARTPGRLPEAIARFRASALLDPGSAKMQDNLGNALTLVPDRLSEAIGHLEAAVRLDPGSARSQHDLGKSLLRVPGRMPDAVEHLEIALRIDPNSADAHSDLGVALLRTPGRSAEAIEHLNAALRIDPGLAEAHYVLGVALSTYPDRQKEAREHVKEALKIKPGFQAARDWLEQLPASEP